MKPKKHLWITIISIMLTLSLVIPLFANTIIFADLEKEAVHSIGNKTDIDAEAVALNGIVETNTFEEALPNVSTIPINAHIDGKWQFYNVGEPVVINKRVGGRINLQAFYYTAEHILPCDKHDNGACSKAHSWACGEKYIPPTKDIAAYNNAPHTGCSYPVKGPACINVSCIDGRILTGVLAAGQNITFQWYESATQTNAPNNATALPLEISNEFMPVTSPANVGTKYFFAEITHTNGTGNEAVVTKYYSDPVKVTIDEFGYPVDQMTTAEASG